jgi:uncharacterized membrane protein YoaK (UPF0700 family)
MHMNKTYIPTLIILLIIAVTHKIAADYHLYVRYYGVDVIMHILGGAGLALAIYWILVTFLPRFTPSFWTIILLSFGAGIAWEILEGVYDIAGAPLGTLRYYVDTAKDLSNDMLGAIIAALCIKK